MGARDTLRSLVERCGLPLLSLGLLLAGSACQRDDDSVRTNYYDRKIGPVVVQSCATSPTKSGCHVAADDHGNALGNLNVTSYDSLSKRQDLFLRYGAYGLPALLIGARLDDKKFKEGKGPNPASQDTASCLLNPENPQ